MLAIIARVPIGSALGALSQPTVPGKLTQVDVAAIILVLEMVAALLAHIRPYYG